MSGRISSDTSVTESGEIALWRAVLEQALHDACLPPSNPTLNRETAKSGRKRDRCRTAARDWLRSAERDFCLVCDFAGLPAAVVQDHAYDLLGTSAEKRSRTLHQVVWRAPFNQTGQNPPRGAVA